MVWSSEVPISSFSEIVGRSIGSTSLSEKEFFRELALGMVISCTYLIKSIAAMSNSFKQYASISLNDGHLVATGQAALSCVFFAVIFCNPRNASHFFGSAFWVLVLRKHPTVSLSSSYTHLFSFIQISSSVYCSYPVQYCYLQSGWSSNTGQDSVKHWARHYEPWADCILSETWTGFCQNPAQDPS